MKRHTFTPTAATVAIAATAVATALLLSACGGGATTTTGASSAPTAGGTASTPGAPGARRTPGTTGLIAQVSGSTMQVQTRTDQTAVTFSPSTAITKSVAGTASSVAVGSCVMVRDDSGGPSTPVAATAVTVSQPVGGRCRTNAFGAGAGFGGAGRRVDGGPNGGTGGGVPTGRPTGTPGGAPGGAARVGGGVVGTVTAVHGSTLTVAPFVRAGGSAAAGSAATANPTSEAPVTVSTSASTTWTLVEKGAASDVRAGECVTAVGKADDTGAVAATSLSLRPAVDGACTVSRRGGGQGRGASATTSAAGNA